LSDDLLAPGALERVQRALYAGVDPAERAWLPASPLSIAERAVALILEVNPARKILIFGGDHSTAWPVVKAMHGAGKRFCIVQMDAHTDLLEERLGNPICFATGLSRERAHRATATAHPARHRATRFRGSIGEHVRRAPAVGQRRASDPAAPSTRSSARPRPPGSPVYFSNDNRRHQCGRRDAPGPEPDGLTSTRCAKLIARLGAEVGARRGDVVEVAPVLGKDGGAARSEVASLYFRTPSTSCCGIPSAMADPPTRETPGAERAVTGPPGAGRRLEQRLHRLYRRGRT